MAAQHTDFHLGHWLARHPEGIRPKNVPEFGWGIHDLVLGPNNSTTIAVVVETVREALVAFEPRIDVLDISAESAPEEPNLLLIRINYRIRANNARGNLVYPFYIQESA